jgi:hypothetical protein
MAFGLSITRLTKLILGGFRAVTLPNPQITAVFGRALGRFLLLTYQKEPGGIPFLDQPRRGGLGFWARLPVFIAIQDRRVATIEGDLLEQA